MANAAQDPIVGIDLGTTHSLVATCDASGPRVLADDAGRSLLPSVVRFVRGGAPVVGHAARAEAAAAVGGPSMTLARAGLRALQCHDTPERSAAMAAFHERWQDKPVILDAWFALEASAPGTARSSTSTSAPASARRNALRLPMSPAPTITTRI